MFTGAGHTDLDHIVEFQDRWEYVRPNFVALSNNQGRYFVNDTDPTNVDRLWLPEGAEGTDWILLSDHNRAGVPLSPNRIGSRQRMINGDMRGYHIADKLNISLSWDNIPSRAYSTIAGYADWKLNPKSAAKFTADGGAGGVEMLKWYEGHAGSMWAFLSFDGVGNDDVPDDVVFRGYSRVYEVYMTEFEYEVSGRSSGYTVGSDTYYLDLWDVSMTLEEV